VDIKIYDYNQKDIWIKSFESLRNKILISSDNKKENYSYKNFNLNHQEFISIVYVNNEIAAFSSLYNRPEWGNVSRIINRCYISKSFRKNSFKSRDILTRQMFEHQIQQAKLLNKDFVFISRQYPSFGWLADILSNPGEYIWKSKIDSLYKVCNANNINCWQHVAYCKLALNDSSFTLPIESINNLIEKKIL